jgi:hypothetical protein
MASARLEKLRSLLKRVEDRRVKPRLQAVAAPRAATPVARPSEEEDFAATIPPAAAPPRAPKRPFEDATSGFDPGALLDMRSLAEPIPTPKAEPRTMAPRPSLPTQPELLVPHRPEAATAPPAGLPMPPPATRAPLAPVVPIQAAPSAYAKPTQPTAPWPSEPPVPVGDLTAPTQTVEPAPLVSASPPVRAVSAVRIETPKSFGELLELSLALRPR